MGWPLVLLQRDPRWLVRSAVLSRLLATHKKENKQQCDSVWLSAKVKIKIIRGCIFVELIEVLSW